jgi:hypothetical protein
VASKPTKSFLDDAPVPSPWYLQSRGPGLPDLKWVRAGESKGAAGKACLMRGDDVVLLVNIYCYVELLSPGPLIIWRQAHAPTGNSEPVMMWGLPVWEPRAHVEIDRSAVSRHARAKRCDAGRCIFGI